MDKDFTQQKWLSRCSVQEIYKFRARFLSHSVTLAGSIDETLEFCRIYTSWAFSNNLTDVHVRTGAVKDPQYHLE